MEKFRKRKKKEKRLDRRKYIPKCERTGSVPGRFSSKNFNTSASLVGCIKSATQIGGVVLDNPAPSLPSTITERKTPISTKTIEFWPNILNDHQFNVLMKELFEN